jgi:DNA replication licensing factor MCM3
VQGIVTRLSIVRPKLVHSAHYCEETKLGTVKEYVDQYSITSNVGEPIGGNFEGKAASYISNTVPTRDMHGNPLSFEYGLSFFKDFQILLIQEPPERTPVGQLPRSVEVILEEDLVDKVKPGDR